MSTTKQLSNGIEEKSSADAFVSWLRCFSNCLQPQSTNTRVVKSDNVGDDGIIAGNASIRVASVSSTSTKDSYIGVPSVTGA